MDNEKELKEYWDSFKEEEEGVADSEPKVDEKEENTEKEPEEEVVEEVIEEKEPEEEEKVEETESEEDQNKENEPDSEQKELDDPWAGVSGDIRTKFEDFEKQLKKYEHELKSDRGRIAALQRQNEELKAATKVHEEKKEAADEAAKDFLSSDDWKKFAEEYPDLAKPTENAIRSAIGPLLQQVEDLRGQVTRLNGAREVDVASRELDRLDSILPDWREKVEGKLEDYNSWLATQPRHIREAAQRNATERGVVDADEAADVLGRFIEFLDSQKPQVVKEEKEKPVPPQPVQKPVPQLSPKRKAQLTAASGVGSRAVPTTPKESPFDSDDPEVIWKALAEQEKRQQRGF